MIEVSRLKDLNAAKLFLAFHIGAVSRRDFAVFPVQGQRGLRRLKRYFGEDVRWRADGRCTQSIHRTLHVARPRSSFEFSWCDVSQTDVFQRSFPRSCSLGW